MEIKLTELIHVCNQVLRCDIDTYSAYTIDEKNNTLIVENVQTFINTIIHVIEELGIEVKSE